MVFNSSYGYGDPHYRSQYGVSLKINNTCSYVLATDNCDLNSSSTAIFVDHENRYGYASNSYMKAIRIKYAGKTLKIEKQFYVSQKKNKLIIFKNNNTNYSF